jgi:hypothetical protein
VSLKEVVVDSWPLLRIVLVSWEGLWRTCLEGFGVSNHLFFFFRILDVVGLLFGVCMSEPLK